MSYGGLSFLLPLLVGVNGNANLQESQKGGHLNIEKGGEIRKEYSLIGGTLLRNAGTNWRIKVG
jgi:hypothetical protein